MPSDGFDIHVEYVKKTKGATIKRGLQWGFNGDVIPATNFDEQEKEFLEVLREKFPDGFRIVGCKPVAVIFDKNFKEGDEP